MPIEFRCCQCQRLLRTPDDAAGKSARCPECGTFTTVPFPAPPGPPLPPGAASGPASPFAGNVPASNTVGESPFAGATSGGFQENPCQSPTQSAPVYSPTPPTDSSALTSLILGCIALASFFTCCCVTGFPVGVAGLIFGMRGLNSPNRSMAIVGMVLSAIAVLLSLGYVGLFAIPAAFGAMVLDLPQAACAPFSRRCSVY